MKYRIYLLTSKIELVFIYKLIVPLRVVVVS